jgi:hypothetical protein
MTKRSLCETSWVPIVSGASSAFSTGFISNRAVRLPPLAGKMNNEYVPEVINLGKWMLGAVDEIVLVAI